MIRIIGAALARGRSILGRSGRSAPGCAVLVVAWLLGFSGASHGEPRVAAGPSARPTSCPPASLAMVSLAAPAARPEPIDSGPQRSKDQNLLAGRVPLAGAEGQPPRLDDASRIAKPPERGNVAPDDQRPIYVVVGIIVLAAVFWWNRRQRDRFDVEDGGSEAAPARRDDDDADDLHAAARGEAQSPDDKIDKTPSKSRPKSS